MFFFKRRKKFSKCIVGLGNPDEKYDDTRHNVGFAFIDYLLKDKAGIYETKNNDSIVYEIEGEGIVCVKPQTYMNKSGIAVKGLMKKYNIAKEELVVVHDDIDIGVGTYKLSKNRGSAGHRGVSSIMQEIGTKDFERVRIGICPVDENGECVKPERVNAFVLRRFREEEKEVLEWVFKATKEAFM